MEFRDARTVGAGRVAEFTITGTGTSSFVWDITDPLNVLNQQPSSSGSTFVFSREADTLRQYIISNGSSYAAPHYSARIENQDLHTMGPKDMLIICYPGFVAAASKLAEFHRQQDNLRVAVVTTTQIYNEFSSGSQDACALRDFIKMFYDRAASLADEPKYVLNFGDASYDNKNRLPSNTNYIVSYESEESLNLSKSYASDDFFGLLDDNEGEWRESDPDLLDISVGRMPVKTLSEADAVVSKIIGYASPEQVNTDTSHCIVQNAPSFGDWRKPDGICCR
jgi:hypothetical protein